MEGLFIKIIFVLLWAVYILWLWTIARVLIVSNLWAGFSGILAWGIVYTIRVPREERMMKENFGHEYTDYMKLTGRVLPKIKPRNI